MNPIRMDRISADPKTVVSAIEVVPETQRPASIDCDIDNGPKRKVARSPVAAMSWLAKSELPKRVNHRIDKALAPVIGPPTERFDPQVIPPLTDTNLAIDDVELADTLLQSVTGPATANADPMVESAASDYSAFNNVWKSASRRHMCTFERTDCERDSKTSQVTIHNGV